MPTVRARAVMVGGLLMFVSSMVPWFVVTAERGRATAWLAGSVAGWSVALLGVATVVAGAKQVRVPASRWRTVVPLLAAVVVGAGAVRALAAPAPAAADAISAVDAERLGLVLEPSELRESLDRAAVGGRLHATPGPGPWLAIAGAAIAAVPQVAAGLAGRRGRRSAVRA